MKKIHYISDLHLEINKSLCTSKFKELEDNHGDICIIAGDMISLSILDNSKQDLNSIQIRVAFKNLCKIFFNKFKYVIYVLGNHEFYDINEKIAIEMCSKNLQSMGKFIVLNNSSIEIEGINFIGSTLWTDFNKNNPIDKLYAKQGLNDYNFIKNKNYKPINPDYIYHKFLNSINFLDKELSLSNKRNVIITHHCPSYRCLNPAFKGDKLNSAFASDLDGFIQYHTDKISHWIYGHNHYNNEFTIGHTNILSNQLGYMSFEENLFNEFNVNKSFILEN